MPELPEVEVCLRSLRAACRDRVVIGATSISAGGRWVLSGDWQSEIVGSKVLDVRRRAKYLQFQFVAGQLVVHLGMSGSFSLSKPNTARVAHDRFELLFSNQAVRLHNPRRFSLVAWLSDQSTPFLFRGLGIEPLSQRLTTESLYLMTRTRRMSLKSFLLDQRFICGIGNIYASEILFEARISPFRAASSLDELACQRLRNCIRRVLKAAVMSGGTTLRDFRHTSGDRGGFQRHLKVYRRAGLCCERCNGEIQRKVHRRRSTFFCACCQV